MYINYDCNKLYIYKITYIKYKYNFGDYFGINKNI